MQAYIQYNFFCLILSDQYCWCGVAEISTCRLCFCWQHMFGVIRVFAGSSKKSAGFSWKSVHPHHWSPSKPKVSLLFMRQQQPCHNASNQPALLSCLRSFEMLFFECLLCNCAAVMNEVEAGGRCQEAFSPSSQLSLWGKLLRGKTKQWDVYLCLKTISNDQTTAILWAIKHLTPGNLNIYVDEIKIKETSLCRKNEGQERWRLLSLRDLTVDVFEAEKNAD